MNFKLILILAITVTSVSLEETVNQTPNTLLPKENDTCPIKQKDSAPAVTKHNSIIVEQGKPKKKERKLFIKKLVGGVGKIFGGVAGALLGPLIFSAAVRRKKDLYKKSFDATQNLLWLYRKDYCRKVCYMDFCQYNAKSFSCKECKRVCPLIANWSNVFHLQPKHDDSRRFFKELYDNPYMCVRYRDEVEAICKLHECRVNISQRCSRCVLQGLKGAKLACGIPYKVKSNFHMFAARFYRYYTSQPKGCKFCHMVKGDPCMSACGFFDPYCKADCEKASLISCYSTCVGGQKLIRKQRTREFLRKQLSRRFERCSGCDTFCPAIIVNFCYMGDVNCVKVFRKFCKHMCKYKFCRHYKKAWNKAMKIKGWQGQGQEIKIEAMAKRHNSKQMLRNMYDYEKKKKLAHITHRFNRDSIFDSLKMMESKIYREVREMSDGLEQREEEREDSIMRQVFSAYSHYDHLKKVTDSEIRIFED